MIRSIAVLSLVLSVTANQAKGTQFCWGNKNTVSVKKKSVFIGAGRNNALHVGLYLAIRTATSLVNWAQTGLLGATGPTLNKFSTIPSFLARLSIRGKRGVYYYALSY